MFHKCFATFLHFNHRIIMYSFIRISINNLQVASDWIAGTKSKYFHIDIGLILVSKHQFQIRPVRDGQCQRNIFVDNEKAWMGKEGRWQRQRQHVHWAAVGMGEECGLHRHDLVSCLSVSGRGLSVAHGRSMTHYFTRQSLVNDAPSWLIFKHFDGLTDGPPS